MSVQAIFHEWWTGTANGQPSTLCRAGWVNGPLGPMYRRDLSVLSAAIAKARPVDKVNVRFAYTVDGLEARIETTTAGVTTIVRLGPPGGGSFEDVLQGRGLQARAAQVKAAMQSIRNLNMNQLDGDIAQEVLSVLKVYRVVVRDVAESGDTQAAAELVNVETMIQTARARFRQLRGN